MWFAQAGVQPLDTSESHPTRIRMWFAEHWAVVGASDNEVTHPTWIRKAFNEQKTTETLPEVLPYGWASPVKGTDLSCLLPTRSPDVMSALSNYTLSAWSRTILH
ncbi:hypothetical protein GCM10027019_31060 [Melaminivora jejuensis]